MSDLFPPILGKIPFFSNQRPVSARKRRKLRKVKVPTKRSLGSTIFSTPKNLRWWEATIGPTKTPSPNRILTWFKTPPEFVGEKGNPKKVLGKGVWTSLREPFFSGEEGVSLFRLILTFVTTSMENHPFEAALECANLYHGVICVIFLHAKSRGKGDRLGANIIREGCTSW